MLAEFRRVLAPGGVVMIGFHAGEGVRHKTEGYGGHRMNVLVYLRSAARVAGWLVDAGFTVEGELVHRPDPRTEGAFVFARR